MSEVVRLASENVQFPDQLKAIPQPPTELYVRGNVKLLSHAPMLAVVGARKASAYGKQALEKLVGPLVQAGVPLVSGLAYGIDALAAQLCITKGVPTVAVLGSGSDDASIYPRVNVRLAHEIIASGGAVISEYPPGTPGTPHRFPERNRIIAGLCPLTLVVQAKQRSGSLITARLALEAGRDVAAVPGSITDLLSQGTNRLIRDGALPITEPDDLLTYFELDGDTQTNTENLTAEQGALLKILSNEPLHIEDVAKRAQQPMAAIAVTLTELELVGAVENVGAHKYVRT